MKLAIPVFALNVCLVLMCYKIIIAFQSSSYATYSQKLLNRLFVVMNGEMRTFIFMAPSHLTQKSCRASAFNGIYFRAYLKSPSWSA